MEEAKVLSYQVLLRKEPEGAYTVIVPTLPGCITFGDTIDEALVNAREAIELYLDSLRDDGEEIPSDEGILEYRMTVMPHA